MADYDIYSNVKPVAGTAAEVVMDGTTYTAAIDTFDWKSCVFLCSIHALAAYDDCSWAMKDSDDGSTFTDVDAEMIHTRNPSDGTTTSKAFHAGYRGKKRYVKAAFECDGTTEGELDITYGSAVTATSVTSSSTTATVTKSGHGLVTGQYVTIAGATQTAYNGRYRITVSSSSVFTYTFAGSGTSPATGTITYVAETPWANNPGADAIASISVGDSALNGDYVVSVAGAISSGSAASIVAYKKGNTGNGVATVSNINAAGASAILNEAITATCTAAASNAGTFTVRRADGTSLGTVTVGATGATLQVDSVNAFKLVVADGATDWIVGDIVEIQITDLGVNKYTLTDPDGTVIGHPLGGIAFTSSHLNFTIPDATVLVSSTSATATITVTNGLAKGQIMALLGNPLSGPIFSDSIET